MLPQRADRIIYLRVLGPLVLVTLTLVVVSVGGFHALSGARAYVGGESLWSKARSQTVVRLRARVVAGQPSCVPLREQLAVPLGDRAARVALERSPPGVDAAREGFLRGGNLPEDLDSMIHMYLNFGSTQPLQEPLRAWRRGDELIEKLLIIGDRICTQSASDVSTNEARENLRDLESIDAQLIEAEKHFSASLGHAAHTTEQLLSVTTMILAVLLVAGSAWFVMRSLRSQIAQRRALIEANARWDLAAGAAGVGVFSWHPRDDTLELDSRARGLYGLNPDTAVSVSRSQTRATVHPEDLGVLDRMSAAAARGDVHLRSRFRIVQVDGSIRHIEAIGMMRYDSGAPTERQLFGVLRDVTDEVAAAQLHSERDAAERSARARTDFLSRLSHELRTPLNAVLGVAQVMNIDNNDPLTAQQRRRVRLILDSGWHLLRLVDDVLDITSIDAGQVKVRAIPTDLLSAVRASLALIEPERSRLDIEVVQHWITEPAQVMADPQRLQQVLVNLLSNACKYNRPSGRITLRCRDDADHVCLAIEDEGSGFDAAQLAELFQPFKRLEQTADIPGTGLGLVVVKLLTEQMQGHIDVKSEPGKGACFTVCLRKA